MRVVVAGTTLVIMLTYALAQSNADGDLVFVLETTRHGARNPVGSDISIGEIPEYIKGELTPMGMRQHFLLGHEMRKRYTGEGNLLDENYNAYEVYVRSTDVNRTIVSAMSHMQGMFPAQSPISDLTED